MNYLAICTSCKRTYDGNALEPGDQFLCDCGTRVKYEHHDGHVSNVVKCGNCGGPRDEKAEDCCPYCKAEWTLHDKDLHTICPQCFTRVSDHSKFCHYCALNLVRKKVFSKDSNEPCPACGPKHKLKHRAAGTKQTPIRECTKCAGLWMNWEDFQFACQSAVRRAPQKFVPLREKHANTSAKQERFYRNCPTCNKVMNRIHYSGRSGIIVDACVESQHGVWFDLGELPGILDWINRGGVPDKRVTEKLSHLIADDSTPAGEPEQTAPQNQVVSEDTDLYVIDEDIDLDEVMASLFSEEK